MSSYTNHRRSVGRIQELTETLAAEAERFHRLAAKHRHPRRTVRAVERSTEWLQHAFRALLMSVVTLQDASHQLQRPRLNGRKR